MPVKNRNYKWLSVVMLVLVVTGFCGCSSPIQRLRVLSESMDASDITEIRELIADGADVNVRNRYDVTPLMMASENGHMEIVKRLLEANADVNAAHTDGRTSLWQASSQDGGYTEIVKLLLEAGADVNAARTDGRTSLWQASQDGYTEIVKLLLEANADVNIARKTDGVTSLFVASGNGHMEIVKLLLGAKADVNAAHKTNGVTPLWMASQNGHTEIVRLLLEANADVNVEAHAGGKDYTPLSIAKKMGYTEIVKLLLEAGAEEENVRAVKNFVNATPSPTVEELSKALLVAVRELGRQKLYRSFDGGGFSGRGRCSSGETILFGDKTIQVVNLTDEEVDKFTETIRVLINTGANPNLLGYKGFFYTEYDEGEIKSSGGAIKVGLGNLGEIVLAENATQSALYIVSRSGRVEVVKILLEAKANVNAACKIDDITSLYAASMKGHTEIVKLLLEAKADVDAADTDGRTSLWMASGYGHTEIVKLLLEARADVNAKATRAGKDYTPLSIAQEMGHKEIVKLLKEYGAKE